MKNTGKGLGNEKMSKGLIVVESPTKVKTIQKFLGGEYVIKASVGHIKDLPEGELGVDLQKDFQPKYITIPGKNKILRECCLESKWHVRGAPMTRWFQESCGTLQY